MDLASSAEKFCGCGDGEARPSEDDREGKGRYEGREKAEDTRLSDEEEAEDEEGSAREALVESSDTRGL